LTSSDSFNRRTDFGKMTLESRAVIGPEFQNGYVAAGHVLLVSHIPICHNYEVETLLFGSIQQFSIAQSTPIRRCRGMDVMARKCPADLHWYAFVEEDLHAASSSSIRRWP
jgi:hypothetical protein